VEFADAARQFATFVGDRPWQLAWCAGAGVVASHASLLENEAKVFASFLDCLREAFGPRTSNGAMFLASSAGGVYAGVGDPPYTESSPVSPLAPYGWKKLEQEELAGRWCEQAAVPLFVGRLSNLYGPGQDLTKAQGLITQVCLRLLAREPLHLYVPLDTVRDYLYQDDAGALVADGLRRLRLDASSPDGNRVVTKILASQQPVTVATVLAQFRWITKRPVSVIVGASPSSRLQVRDLRMVSTVWPELDRRSLTSLAVGMRAVLTRILLLAGDGRITVEAVGRT